MNVGLPLGFEYSINDNSLEEILGSKGTIFQPASKHLKDEIVSCEINSVVPLPVLFSSIVYLLAKFRISHHFLSRTNNCSTKTNTSLEMLSNFYFKSYSAHTRPPAPSSYFMEKKERTDG